MAPEQQFPEIPDEFVKAHDHCTSNRSEVLASGRCGCFCCCQTFPAMEISEWCDDQTDGVGQTALCPKCGVDSVIGDKAGLELSSEFLTRMNAHWF